jgi:transcriptional regulator with XRE-family HTH domain
LEIVMTKARSNPLSEAFGELITRHRKQKGWSVLALSVHAQLSINHLRLLESGRNVPSIHTLFLLATIFGVRPSDLVREVEEVVEVTLRE